MLNSKEKLGEFVRAQREYRALSQDEVVNIINRKLKSRTNRSAVAHFEQGLRIPKAEVLKEICDLLSVPPKYWHPFINPESSQRFEFEEVLSELVGASVTLDGHDDGAKAVAERQIAELMHASGSARQTLDRLNSILVYYGAPPVTEEFATHYLPPTAFTSTSSLELAVKNYQKHAIRLFSTLADAYRAFNQPGKLLDLLDPLKPHPVEPYSDRTGWHDIEKIPDDNLPDLGYIAASRVKQESAERQALKQFLESLARAIRKHGRQALSDIDEKTRRKMDSLLRKFNSNIRHGLLSPLFAPDSVELEQEAARLAPLREDEIARIAETQATGLRNLARYLSADHMDVYVATSMRSDADFISVNHFVRNLFDHDKLRGLNLRLFNPTQSWIEDRIAKGLVEALMLRRAAVTIYMAQKSDTFGKDSEASVALGQGKPVIVYVPKLVLSDGSIDTEKLFQKPRSELVELLNTSDREEIDETVDTQGIVGRIVTTRLERCSDEELAEVARLAWADFDLHSEAGRLDDPTLKADYRNWLDLAIQEKAFPETAFRKIRSSLIGIFVANAIRFEQRAKTFREIHPLALQVILSSGVLNGILVVRSVDQCAHILEALVRNELKLGLQKDEHNYRLVEELTGSTIRVISRHRLLQHAFQAFYGNSELLVDH